MTTALIVIGLFVAVFVLPVLVFFCVKLGTYGYLSALRNFRNHQPKVKTNGNEA